VGDIHPVLLSTKVVVVVQFFSLCFLLLSGSLTWKKRR